MGTEYPWFVPMAIAVVVTWIREATAPRSDDIELSVDRSVAGAAIVVLLVAVGLRM